MSTQNAQENCSNQPDQSASTKEILTSTSCYIDPEVTKVSEEIYETIEQDKQTKHPQETKMLKPEYCVPKSFLQNVPKEIQAAGKRLFEKYVADFNIEEPDVDIDIENEAVQIEYVDGETVEKIKKIAQKNPVTNELIEYNKQFFHNNKEKIEKQMKELVAFYSVKDQKPFYFVTPSEARLAIDYIKKVKNGFLQDKEEEQKRDIFVKGVIENYK